MPDASRGGDGLLDRLPHKPPFRMVDHVSEVRPGRWAKGHKVVTGDFDGILACESLAQLSKVLDIASAANGSDEEQVSFLVRVDVSLGQDVPAGVVVDLYAELANERSGMRAYSVRASAAGTDIVKGTIFRRAFTDRGAGRGG